MTNTALEKVSIIMPVYNAEQFVERSIKSVLDQTYFNIELIVVNDGSDDNTQKICDDIAKRDNRIKVISQTNQGVSAARNNGMSWASGDYISFMDADDYIDNNAIETMVELIEREKVDIVRTHWREIRESATYVGRERVDSGIYNTKDQIDFLRYEVASGGMHSFVFLLLIKAELIKRNDIQFVVGVPMMEDTCFYVDTLRAAKSVFISDNITYNYVLHSESASRSADGFADKIKSVVDVDRYITRTGFTNSQMCNIKASHISVISNMVTARTRGVFDRARIVQLLKEVHGTDGVVAMYKSSNLSFLDFYHRIEVCAVMRRRVFVMQGLMAIRKVLGR